MLKRNWLQHYPAGIGIVLIGLWGWFLYNQYHQPQDAYCGTAEQCYGSRDATKVAPNVTGSKSGVPDARSEPPVTDPKAYRDERRSEADLEAQRQMAKWAFWQLFVTGITAVLTGGGIYYVASTLHEAQRSSEAAVLMAKAMVGTELPILTPRWVGVEYVETDAPFVEGEGPYGGVTDGMESPAPHGFVPMIPFRNFGRTPAFVETISLGYAVEKILPDTPVFTKEKSLNKDTIVSAEPQKEPENVMVDFGIELSPEQLTAMGNGTADLWFYFKVTYRDFMNDTYEDTFCARYAQRHDEFSPYDFASDGGPPAAYTKRRQPKEQEPAQT